MDRKVKLLVGGVGVAVLLAILGLTSLGASAEFVEPTDLAETDAYDGEAVQLEGRAVDIDEDGELTFDIVDENHSVAVRYDGQTPETMSEGRLVVAEGVFDGTEVTAEELTIRAHEGEGEHPEGYNKSGYDGSGYNKSYDGNGTATADS